MNLFHSETQELDRKILSYIRLYSRVEHIPEGPFNDLFLKLFSYQYRYNRPYRRFCEIEKKSPQNVSDWRAVPALPVDGFKHFALRTFSTRKTCKVFRTSGTSTLGRVRGCHYFDSLKLYAASSLPAFKKAMMSSQKSPSFFCLLSSPKELKDSSLSWMAGFLRSRLGAKNLGGFYVRRAILDSERLVKDLIRLKRPAILLTTSFSLANLMHWMSQRGIRLRLPAGTRLMETGGFKSRTKEIPQKMLHDKVRKLLGIPPSQCIGEYGMTELSSQFYNCQGSVYADSAWLRALLIDPLTGREVAVGRKGLIRIFDLANRGSVAAIQTEDLGIRRKGGFELVGRARRSEIRGCSLTYEA